MASEALIVVRGVHGLCELRSMLLVTNMFRGFLALA